MLLLTLTQQKQTPQSEYYRYMYTLRVSYDDDGGGV